MSSVSFGRELEISGLARFEFERPTFFSFRTPIEVEVYSDNLTELHLASRRAQGAHRADSGLGRRQVLGGVRQSRAADRTSIATSWLSSGSIWAMWRTPCATRCRVRSRRASPRATARSTSSCARWISGRLRSATSTTSSSASATGVPIYLKSVAEVQPGRGPERDPTHRAEANRGDLGQSGGPRHGGCGGRCPGSPGRVPLCRPASPRP